MDIDFSALSTTEYGNILSAQQCMDSAIRPLWAGMPRIAGAAFTVQLAAGDNLMLHKAIYEAPAGSVLVVDGVDLRSAVAGGNVCAVAQQNGIVGFIIDGVIRDIEEIRDIRFPVYARGLFPVPGKKNRYIELAQPVVCGGVRVRTGDIIVADEDGVAVIPGEDAADVFERARARAMVDRNMPLSAWERDHRAKVEQAMAKARNA
ncbi:RraA family protein [Chloroflexia bacterium SDU3-3]|nr:RraA family protein [Chloroflexia bacterium SDU3-3]